MSLTHKFALTETLQREDIQTLSVARGQDVGLVIEPDVANREDALRVGSESPTCHYHTRAMRALTFDLARVGVEKDDESVSVGSGVSELALY